MIADEILEYCELHTSPEPDVLNRLNRETHLTQVYPRMLSGHLQGTFLRMISAMIKPRRVLEIGTFTGYSAICLGEPLLTPPLHPSPCRGGEGGEVLSCGVLHTIESNPELEPMIRKYIREAGLEQVIRLHIGDAVEIVPTLDEVWDLVFIDADKPNYLNYYNKVLPKVRQGGYILADNALWDGRVLDTGTTDKETRGIIEFNDFVRQDQRVENMLLPLRDGIMLIRKL
jgi:caffeoyl-CoA O-methyltransferase